MDMDRFEPGQSAELVQPPVLDTHIIGAIQVIEPGDEMAVVDQPFDNFRTDETRATGDENS